MPEYQIEMLWRCDICHGVNKGRHKTCQGCGKPLTTEQFVMPDDMSEAAAVTDPEQLKHAKAGADWTCVYCQSKQRKRDGTCAQCGAAPMLFKPVADPKASPEEAFYTSPAKEDAFVDEAMALHGKGGPNDGLFENLEKDKHPLPKRPPPVEYAADGDYRKAPTKIEPPPPAEFYKGPGSPYDTDEDEFASTVRAWQQPKLHPAFFMVTGILFVLGVLGYFIFRTQIIDAHVSTVSWTHTTHIDRYQVNHHDGFDVQNGAFDVHNEGRRLHHYDHVIDHYDTVPYTVQEACGQDCTPIPRSCYRTSKTCSSNKNGYASCSGGDQVCSGGGQSCPTKYCTRYRTREEPVYRDDPVYRDYYDWNIWEWTPNRVVLASGDTTETHWPPPEETHLDQGLTPGQQERAWYEGHYKLVWASGKETWDYLPKSLGEFETYPVGTKRKLKIGVAHGVEILIPAAR